MARQQVDRWCDRQAFAAMLSRRAVLKGVGASLAAGALAPLMPAALGDLAGVAVVAAATGTGVPGVPFDTATGYTAGPADPNAVYGLNRQFFPVSDPGRWGVVWQSQGGADKGQIYATWFGADAGAPGSTTALLKSDDALACAASDDGGAIFVLTIQTGDGRPFDARRTTLTRFAAGATTGQSATLDAGPNGLNMIGFGSSGGGVAAMLVANGTVAVMLGRTMTQSSDKLNHQGGIIRLYDAATLAQTADHGQSGSHSWSNTLARTAGGQFLAAEICDNYPRGVQIHRFDAAGKNARVVYTYKTAHGTEAKSPAGKTYPAYPEISGNGKQYYKWSNDNTVYTELGGVAETDAGYLVVFAGERPSLDNSKAGPPLNTGRNIGAVVVRKDFEAVPLVKGDTWVSDDLMVTKGNAEEGSYYDFDGGQHAQRNTGVVWLTDYAADRRTNATRIKVAPLGGGEVMLLWEVWGPSSYAETFAMTVRPEGGGITVVRPASSLGTAVRLNPRDDVVVRDGKVYIVAGDGANKQLLVTVVDPASLTGAASQAPAAPAATPFTAAVAPASAKVGDTVTFTLTIPPAAVAPGSVVTLTLDAALDLGTTELPALPAPSSLNYASKAQEDAYRAGTIASVRSRGSGDPTVWAVTMTFPQGLPEGAIYTLKAPATVLSKPASGTATSTAALTGGPNGATSTQQLTVTVA